MQVPGGFAVTPKHDCPHLATFARRFSAMAKRADEFMAAPCATCGDTSENWLNIGHECKVLCSRYVSGHAVDYYSAHPSECIGISFSDLSVWCYKCDSYIRHHSLGRLLRALARAKFAREEGTIDEDGVADGATGVASGASATRSDESEAEAAVLDPSPLLTSADVAGAGSALKEGRARRVLVLVGSLPASVPEESRAAVRGMVENMHKNGSLHRVYAHNAKETALSTTSIPATCIVDCAMGSSDSKAAEEDGDGMLRASFARAVVQDFPGRVAVGDAGDEEAGAIDECDVQQPFDMLVCVGSGFDEAPLNIVPSLCLPGVPRVVFAPAEGPAPVEPSHVTAHGDLTSTIAAFEAAAGWPGASATEA